MIRSQPRRSSLPNRTTPRRSPTARDERGAVLVHVARRHARPARRSARSSIDSACCGWPRPGAERRRRRRAGRRRSSLAFDDPTDRHRARAGAHGGRRGSNRSGAQAPDVDRRRRDVPACPPACPPASPATCVRPRRRRTATASGGNAAADLLRAPRRRHASRACGPRRRPRCCRQRAPTASSRWRSPTGGSTTSPATTRRRPTFDRYRRRRSSAATTSTPPPTRHAPDRAHVARRRRHRHPAHAESVDSATDPAAVARQVPAARSAAPRRRRLGGRRYRRQHRVVRGRRRCASATSARRSSRRHASAPTQAVGDRRPRSTLDPDADWDTATPVDRQLRRQRRCTRQPAARSPIAVFDPDDFDCAAPRLAACAVVEPASACFIDDFVEQRAGQRRRDRLIDRCPDGSIAAAPRSRPRPTFLRTVTLVR